MRIFQRVACGGSQTRTLATAEQTRCVIQGVLRNTYIDRCMQERCECVKQGGSLKQAPMLDDVVGINGDVVEDRRPTEGYALAHGVPVAAHFYPRSVLPYVG